MLKSRKERLFMAIQEYTADVKGLTVLAPQAGSLSEALTAKDIVPFSHEIMRFAGGLSRALMKSKEARRFPEIISLGHWMRPLMLQQMKQAFEARQPDASVRLARGMVLHFAPGNVDTIFLYSALLSILCGNRNIVRVSSRPSPQLDLLVQVLNEMFEKPEYESFRHRLCIVRYGHSDQITQTLSDGCDLRVVWGGDATVNAIRRLPIPPGAREICFPDRWSLAVTDASWVCTASDDALQKLALDFTNDSYWFGQMACSSPRLMLWRGDKQDAAKAAKIFWGHVRIAAQRFAPDISPVGFVNKLVSSYTAAIEGDIVEIVSLQDNIVSLSEMKDLQAPPDDLCVGDGMFWQSHISDLDELAALLDHKSQTIISHGISQSDWMDFSLKTSPRIDRIVPFGRALQFGEIWDGFDLLAEFSRLTAIDV